MELKLYDTPSQKKRIFVPIDPERITVYVCGPTVYDFAHIGNFRPPVVFDVLFRLLRYLYGEDHVLYAANVTDVDDKINRRAHEHGVEVKEFTQVYIDAYNADSQALGNLPVTFQPKATETIDSIVALIDRLITQEAAYPADGHVLFDTAAFPDYGKFSARKLEDLIDGARVDVAPYKRDPRDFVLWKPSKENEPVWSSPWGPGRPGWHIECTAMIENTLGLPIDIHGGGSDLIFPHHEKDLCVTTGFPELSGACMVFAVFRGCFHGPIFA
jgi:cysteinyl-tRNA synthetase